MGIFVLSFSPGVISVQSTRPVTVSAPPPSVLPSLALGFLVVLFLLLHFHSSGFITLSITKIFSFSFSLFFPSTPLKPLRALCARMLLFHEHVWSCVCRHPCACTSVFVCACVSQFYWQRPVNSLRNVSVVLRLICSYLVLLRVRSQGPFSESLLCGDSELTRSLLPLIFFTFTCFFLL